MYSYIHSIQRRKQSGQTKKILYIGTENLKKKNLYSANIIQNSNKKHIFTAKFKPKTHPALVCIFAF